MSWWQRLGGYAWPYRGQFAAVLLLTLLATAIAALAPWPLKLVIDHVLGSEPWPAWLSAAGDRLERLPPPLLLGAAALAVLFIFSVRQLAQALRMYIQSGAASRMKYDLARDIFGTLQALSLQFHQGRKVGDLVRRVNADTDCIRQLVTGLVIPLLTSLTTIVIMFILLFGLNAELAALALVAVVPMPILIQRMTPGMTARSFEQHQAQGELTAVAEQAMSTLPVIQAFGREQHEYQKFRSVSHRAIRSYLDMIAMQIRFRFGTGGATATGTALVMLFGGKQVLEGNLTVGGLIVFLSYLAALYQPLEVLAYLSSTYADAKARAQRVLQVLDADQRVQEPAAKARQHIAFGKQGLEVRFENVYFDYAGDERKVLYDINLHVAAGETVALVGTTGAGKSTLVSLIPRFFDVRQGRVLVNGIDVRNVSTGELRSLISLVIQEPFLFPVSIAENIAYGRPDATIAEIETAAVAANADDFIRRLPHGYDTKIGERGASLSGGQRQRLSIARAVLKDAPLLILDEPTSALDAKTESSVMQAIDTLRQGRTSFIIAHRLSTIRSANRIIVLEQGRIVESGSHEQLLDFAGRYRDLYELSKGGGSAIVTA